MRKPLRLESHQLIDMSELTQHECLGTGGFGAVYRGDFKGNEVAIKKLFCEDIFKKQKIYICIYIYINTLNLVIRVGPTRRF